MEKAVKRSEGQRIGEQGELVLERCLSKWCTTNKVVHDYGEDFICSIVDSNNHITEKMFYAQCKGHESIDINKEFYSETIQATTLLQWVKRKNLTLLFIVDITKDEIYYVDPTMQINNNLEKIEAQQSLDIKVPLKNKISKQSSLPKNIILSIDSFDLELFDVNGTYIKTLEYLNTFTEKDWYSHGTVPEIDDSEQSISIKFKNIHFFGYYWDSSGALSGACQINIARFKKMAESSIELGPKELLDYLYFGRNTIPSFEYKKNYRRYIRVPLPDYEQYNVHFGNSTIYLYPNELEELNKVIDIFIKKYTSKLLRYSQRYNMFGYTPIKGDLNKIRLMTVSEDLWKEMLEYKEKYIVPNGEYEKGYYFEPFNGCIALAEKNSIITKFYVTAEYKLNFWRKEPEVEIIWNAPDSLAYVHYDKDSWYNTRETYNFIIKNIIMKIRTSYKYYKSHFFRKQKLIDDKNYFISGENPPIKILSDNKKLYFLKSSTTKEKVENNFVSENQSYKLGINDIRSIDDLIQLFIELSSFIRDRGYVLDYEVEEISIFAEYIIKTVGKIFINGNNYADNNEKEYFEGYFESYKKDVISLSSQLKDNPSEDRKSQIYASLFQEFYNMLGDFREHLDFIDFKSYLSNFSKIIALYNEEKLIKLLID